MCEGSCWSPETGLWLWWAEQTSSDVTRNFLKLLHPNRYLQATSLELLSAERHLTFVNVQSRDVLQSAILVNPLPCEELESHAVLL